MLFFKIFVTGVLYPPLFTHFVKKFLFCIFSVNNYSLLQQINVFECLFFDLKITLFHFTSFGSASIKLSAFFFLVTFLVDTV